MKTKKTGDSVPQADICLIYFSEDDNCWVAHGLHTDQIGTGDWFVDALADYLVGIDAARFKKPVIPGDQLKLEVDIIKTKRGVWKFNGVASVDGEVVCTAELMCAERKV